MPRRLDPHSGQPLYRQLADVLRGMITSGRLETGAYLPPEERLAHDYAVGRDTVRDALALLRYEGLIETVRGKPSRVREAKERSIMTPEPGTRITTRMPTDAERGRLELAPGVPVFVVDHAGETHTLPGDSTVIEIPPE